MNREIIFRGKSLNNIYSINKEEPEVKIGDLVYGDLEIQRTKDKWIIHIYHEDGTYDKQVEVDKDTVGQYTGLKDKNGKMIFEGDVVKCGDFIYEVGYDNKRFASFVLIRKIDFFKHYFGEAMEANECEVIGNIHEQNYKL